MGFEAFTGKTCWSKPETDGCPDLFPIA